MSHDFIISSSLIVKPMFRICSATNSFFIMSSNSCLSKRPFPSASAFLKASRRNSMNALAFSSASLISCSFRSTVAATMLSLATAVSTEIIVHDTKTMKTTKNMDQAGLSATSGPAMVIQSSCVLTRNRVKRAVGTSWKYSLTVCHISSSMPSKPPMGTSLLPISRVITIAKQTMTTLRKEKIHIMVLNISKSACTKDMSLGNSFTKRNIRSSRNNRTNFKADEWLEALVVPLDCVMGSSEASKSPNTTIVKSSMPHPASFAKKPQTPRWAMRSAISRRNSNAKMTSTVPQPFQSGWSVSEISTTTFAPINALITVWNLLPSTKSKTGKSVSSCSRW
mmetsp:Transcript_64781/g.172763  ORF Transcript_64781/g.172763 Transcript_64781/m.172763 type:complete len:337 (-) Transcript_64781:92-1102(-)